LSLPRSCKPIGVFRVWLAPGAGGKWQVKVLQSGAGPTLPPGSLVLRQYPFADSAGAKVAAGDASAVRTVVEKLLPTYPKPITGQASIPALLDVVETWLLFG
jgi:hypothetical protein